MRKLVASACAGLAMLTTACASAVAKHTTPTRNAVAAAPELHGQWVLNEVIDDGHVTNVSRSLDLYLVFGKNREIRGFDGCAHYDGTLRRSAGGATRAVNIGISSNGCLELPAPVATARHDVDIALYRSRPINLSETVDRLTLTIGGHTLTYVPRR